MPTQSCPRTTAPLADRLWPKVNGPWYGAVGEDDCWLWFGNSIAKDWRSGDSGPRKETGRCWWYGRIHAPTADQPKRLIGAHRAAYEVAIGPIPEGLLLRHLCDVHLCCNPRHLQPGTPAENSEDVRRHGLLKGQNQHTRRREVAA